MHAMATIVITIKAKHIKQQGLITNPNAMVLTINIPPLQTTMEHEVIMENPIPIIKQQGIHITVPGNIQIRTIKVPTKNLHTITIIPQENTITTIVRYITGLPAIHGIIDTIGQVTSLQGLIFTGPEICMLTIVPGILM